MTTVDELRKCCICGKTSTSGSIYLGQIEIKRGEFISISVCKNCVNHIIGNISGSLTIEHTMELLGRIVLRELNTCRRRAAKLEAIE